MNGRIRGSINPSHAHGCPLLTIHHHHRKYPKWMHFRRTEELPTVMRAMLPSTSPQTSKGILICTSKPNWNDAAVDGQGLLRPPNPWVHLHLLLPLLRRRNPNSRPRTLNSEFIPSRRGILSIPWNGVSCIGSCPSSSIRISSNSSV